MNNKRRNTAFNLISTVLTRFILLFGGFIISIILARMLGPEGMGVITAIFVFPLLMVSLADMGIRQSSAFYIGKQEYEISDIISSIAFLWIVTSALSITLGFLYFSYGPSSKYSWIILSLALVSIPIKLIEQYAKGIMLGKNRISTINISQIIRLIANFISVIILVWIFDLDVLGAVLVQIIIALTVSIYYLVKITKEHKIKFRSVFPIPRLLVKKGFGFAAALFLINLNYKIDIVFLDYMVTAKEIGIYSIGVNFSELLWQIPSAVGMVLFAKSTTTKSTIDSINRSTTILRIILPIMIFASIIVAIFAPILIEVLYGGEYKEAGNLLRILLPGICLITVSKILHPDLAGRGYPLYALKVFIITLIINILLNFLFIPLYGINGAAMASTISYIASGIGFGLVYSRKEKVLIRDIFITKKEDVLLIRNSITGKIKSFKK